MQITAPWAATILWKEYEVAQSAKSRWTAHEKDLKQKLLEQVTVPEGAGEHEILTPGGKTIGTLKVGSRKGLDINYLREKYPDIYAECERWTYPVSLRTDAAWMGAE